MKKKLPKLILILCTILILSSFQADLRSEDDLHRVWAVKDCRIVTQAGAPIEKGAVVIRNGLIEAVGQSISIPQDAEVIDGSELTVYPGLIDALGQSLIKLPEEKFDPTKVYTGQFTDKDRGITPELKAFDHFQISKSSLEKYHKFGFTTAHVMPQKGIFTGQSSVFSLSDLDKEANVILKDNFLGIGFSPSSFMVYPNSLMGVVSLLRQKLSDASHYQMLVSRWAKEMNGIPRPPYDAKLDILSDYATGQKTVAFLCRNQHDIRRALSMAAELKLNFFICDVGNEAFRVIPELKKSKAKVLCPVNFKMPGTSVHGKIGKAERERAEKDIYVKNPAQLEEAGIPFAFSSLGTDDPKSFIEGVQKAVENGVSPQKALDTLTSTAANFLGVEKALGTVEPGKIANLILVQGEILTSDAKVKHVFVDGKRFEIKEVSVKEGEKPTVNVSGKWELTVEGVGMTFTIDFVQEEAALSGKMTTPMGVFDFSGGSVANKEIYFEMVLSVGGQEIDLYFSAVVDGDRMEGSVIQGTEGSMPFTGKRIPG